MYNAYSASERAKIETVNERFEAIDEIQTTKRMVNILLRLFERFYKISFERYYLLKQRL